MPLEGFHVHTPSTTPTVSPGHSPRLKPLQTPTFRFEDPSSFGAPSRTFTTLQTTHHDVFDPEANQLASQNQSPQRFPEQIKDWSKRLSTSSSRPDQLTRSTEQSPTSPTIAKGLLLAQGAIAEVGAGRHANRELPRDGLVAPQVPQQKQSFLERKLGEGKEKLKDLTRSLSRSDKNNKPD